MFALPKTFFDNLAMPKAIFDNYATPKQIVCKFCLHLFYILCIFDFHNAKQKRFARFVTFLTGYHTIIMLVLHVHPQMFFGKSFKAAYDTRKHGDCRFVLLAMMLCVPNVIIFPYKKENILGKKLYVLNSGTTTFDEVESIGSKCTFGNHLKPGLSRPGGPKQ